MKMAQYLSGSSSVTDQASFIDNPCAIDPDAMDPKRICG